MFIVTTSTPGPNNVLFNTKGMSLTSPKRPHRSIMCKRCEIEQMQNRQLLDIHF